MLTNEERLPPYLVPPVLMRRDYPIPPGSPSAHEERLPSYPLVPPVLMRRDYIPMHIRFTLRSPIPGSPSALTYLVHPVLLRADYPNMVPPVQTRPHITWFPPVFMNDDEISDVICLACLHQLTHHIVSSVEPLGIGKQQPQLLREKKQVRDMTMYYVCTRTELIPHPHKFKEGYILLKRNKM